MSRIDQTQEEEIEQITREATRQAIEKSQYGSMLSSNNTKVLRGKAGSVDNKGITWDNYKREEFGGPKITAENKRSLIDEYVNGYVDSLLYLVDSGEKTVEQLRVDGEKAARNHINFFKKMEREYRKGRLFMTWRGQKERVVTQEYLTRMQAFMNRLEEQHIEKQKEKSGDKSNGEQNNESGAQGPIDEIQERPVLQGEV